MTKAALGFGIVSSAVVLQAIGLLAEPPREVTQRFCVSAQCPTPTDVAGEVGKLRGIVVGMSASSNFSSAWQFGSIGPNLGPFLP